MSTADNNAGITAPDAGKETPEIEAGTQPDAKAAEGKVLTQADIDTAVTARLAREQKKFDKQLADEKAKWEADKDLSEIDRLKKENADLKAAKTEGTVKASLIAALEKAGSADADDNDLLVERYKADLKVNDAGEITNLAEVIKAIKEDRPKYFVKKVTTSADAGSGGKTVVDAKAEFNKQLRAMLGR